MTNNKIDQSDIFKMFLVAAISVAGYFFTTIDKNVAENTELLKKAVNSQAVANERWIHHDKTIRDHESRLRLIERSP